MALTVIGLMPGDTNERGLPLAVVLVGFALVLIVNFIRYLKEKYGSAKQSDWEDYEWKSPQERRQDLRWRRSTRAHSRSGSRVLGLGSGRPKLRGLSERRQEELRIEQGRRDAARSHSRDRLRRRRSVSVEKRDPIDNEREPILKRPSEHHARNRQLSGAAERHQEELRIEQGRRYAREADFSAKVGGTTVGERRKRARQRSRRDGPWWRRRSIWMY